MDTSITDIVANHPVESIILWSKLHPEGKKLLSECVTDKFTRLQFVKLYYAAVALCSYEVFKIRQETVSDVAIETSDSFAKFSQTLLLDGEYKCKTYIPTLLELSRLAARSYIIHANNVPDKSTFNTISKRLKIPTDLSKYISFKSLNLDSLH